MFAEVPLSPAYLICHAKHLNNRVATLSSMRPVSPKYEMVVLVIAWLKKFVPIVRPSTVDERQRANTVLASIAVNR